MAKNISYLNSRELYDLLRQEQAKFIKAIEYQSTYSDLQEIRETIKHLEALISSRQAIPQRH
jgi:hypothetical protein